MQSFFEHNQIAPWRVRAWHFEQTARQGWKSLLSNTLTCSRQQVRGFTMVPSRPHCSPCTRWLWSTWPCWCHRAWCHWVIGGNDSTYWIFVGCTCVGVWGVCVLCPNAGPATLKSGWVYTAWIRLVLLPQDKMLVLGQHINLHTVGQDVFFPDWIPRHVNSLLVLEFCCESSPDPLDKGGCLVWGKNWHEGEVRLCACLACHNRFIKCPLVMVPWQFP